MGRFEALVRDAVAIAERLLAGGGELAPFGLSEGTDGGGGIHAVRGLHYPSEILRRVVGELQGEARAGRLRACAVVTLVQVSTPAGELATAVRVDCEASDGEAVTWFFPLQASAAGAGALGPPSCAAHEPVVFTPGAG
jgi:hypothetical protein